MATVSWSRYNGYVDGTLNLLHCVVAPVGIVEAYLTATPTCSSHNSTVLNET